MVLGIFHGNISGVALLNWFNGGQRFLDEGPKGFMPVAKRPLGLRLWMLGLPPLKPEIFSDLNNTSLKMP